MRRRGLKGGLMTITTQRSHDVPGFRCICKLHGVHVWRQLLRQGAAGNQVTLLPELLAVEAFASEGHDPAAM